MVDCPIENVRAINGGNIETLGNGINERTQFKPKNLALQASNMPFRVSVVRLSE